MTPFSPPSKDKRQGLQRKYNVERVDGSSAPGGKHEHCAYYVLDLVHDKHAVAAIKAYAKSCAKAYPKLSKELLSLSVGKKCAGCGGDGVEADACGCREAFCPHLSIYPSPCSKCKGWGVARKRAKRSSK